MMILLIAALISSPVGPPEKAIGTPTIKVTKSDEMIVRSEIPIKNFKCPKIEMYNHKIFYSHLGHGYYKITIRTDDPILDLYINYDDHLIYDKFMLENPGGYEGVVE